MQGTTNPRGGVQVTRAGPDDTGWVTVTKVFTPEEDEVKAIGTRVLRGWTPTTFSMREGEPNSCCWQGGFSAQFQRGDWKISFAGGYEVRSTPEEFWVMEFVRASEADHVIFEREWRQGIKRDLM